MSTIKVDAKDSKYRDFALNGSMWKVIFHVGLPLALYQSLGQLFKILDSIMASYISSASVSTVAYMSSINLMLSAIGGGLAVGASLKISEAYGAGDYDLVRKRVSSLFAMCAVLGGIFLLVIPFTRQLLLLANTPIDMVDIGTTYFQIELFGMVLSFFTNVYIAVERARGNARRILYLNLISIGIKLVLTAFFVYVIHSDITMISVATCVSYLFLMVAAIINMRGEGAFSFHFGSISFKKKITLPMLITSFPVIIEKVFFQFGKVIINSMSTLYGTLTVGALGISNNIGGITTSPQNGFQEAGAAVISQNIGGDKHQRALDAFKKVAIIDVAIGFVGCALTLIFLDQITFLFAYSSTSYDAGFAELIKSVYVWEALGAVPLGINAAVMALLYGYGYTRLTLGINVARVFLYRIPVLWLLQNFTNIGSASVGLVMGISNTLTGITALIVAIIVIRKECKAHNLTFFKKVV